MKLLVDSSLVHLATPYILVGGSAFIHNPSTLSTFDTFDKINPEIYFCDLKMLKKSTISNIKERPYLKVLFIDEENDTKNQEIVKSEFGNVYKIIKDIGCADAISCKSAVKKYSDCDIISIDQAINYKNLNLPLKYKVRIFSKNIVPSNYYCGVMNEKNIFSAYKSSKLTFDSGSQMMNIILCGSYPINNLDKEYLLSKLESDINKEILEKRKEILDSKTNLHVCSNLFRELDENIISNNILSKIGEFK